MQPTTKLAMGPRISLPRASGPRYESVEPKHDNWRAHNGSNCTKKRNLLLAVNGHQLLRSPKYHTELTGVGIEYRFGRVVVSQQEHNVH